MAHSAPALVLILAGAALLLCAALHDIGFRTVPDRVSLAILFCGLILRLLQNDMLAGVLCGLAVFAVSYACWHFGWMGGGDVKLLGACAVFVPPVMVPTLLLATSLAGGAVAFFYLFGSRLAPKPSAIRPQGLIRRALRCELRRLRRRRQLPYAAAIATGGLIAIVSS